MLKSKRFISQKWLSNRPSGNTIDIDIIQSCKLVVTSSHPALVSTNPMPQSSLATRLCSSKRSSFLPAAKPIEHRMQLCCSCCSCWDKVQLYHNTLLMTKSVLFFLAWGAFRCCTSNYEWKRTYWLLAYLQWGINGDKILLAFLTVRTKDKHLKINMHFFLTCNL